MNFSLVCVLLMLYNNLIFLNAKQFIQKAASLALAQPQNIEQTSHNQQQ